MSDIFSGEAVGTLLRGAVDVRVNDAGEWDLSASDMIKESTF